MPDEVVLTPGGYRLKSRVHFIEPDCLVGGHAGRLSKVHRQKGVVADLGPMVQRPGGEPLLPANIVRRAETPAAAGAGPVPNLGSGWITYASWTRPAGQHVALFKTAWTVPPPPATQSGQTVFLFNGIQNSSMIYQPVLQWGPSAAGGGNYWAVASWYADGQTGHSFYSSLVRVNPGDVLVGVMAITGQQTVLGDTSPVSPSLASLGGRLYIAWKGDGNDNLNVMYSADNGATFGNKYTSPETSPKAPALCVHNGNLYIAWKGDGNDNLNVARVNIQGNAITGLVNKVTLRDTSPQSPALASLGGRLYIAWKGDGNDNLNVMYSADNGATFANKYTSPETSPQAPALTAHNGNLYIGWKGDGNDNLNVARVNIQGNAITGFVNKVILGDTSPVSPTLASLNGRLYLGWKGDGNDNLNVMYSADNGATFGNKYISIQTSPQPPALASHNGNLYIGWKGDGNDNLNVSEVAISGAAIAGFMGAGSAFSYDCYFQGIANTNLPIGNIEELYWCVETLEAYGITKAFDYPETWDTKMQGIELRLGPAEATLNWLATNAVTDTGQHTIVVSDASPGGDVDLYYFSSFFIDKRVLGDTSPVNPALASLNGRLYLGWKGDGNDNLNVMYSADNGNTFGNKYTSPETSPKAPALCAHNGSLYIAWKGDGNDNLNVARVNLQGNAITGFVNKVILRDTSPQSPALASLNGRLYIAWKGDGNDNLNVMYSADNGNTFGNKYTSPETSPQAPALTVHNGNLYIGWKGDGNDNLNVARVNIQGNAITGFVNKAILGDTSPVSPALASMNGRLYIGWKGDGNDYLNVMYSADNGATFGNKYTSPETSPQAPALAMQNNILFIGWKGDGNDNLNVAQVAGGVVTPSTMEMEALTAAAATAGVNP